MNKRIQSLSVTEKVILVAVVIITLYFLSIAAFPKLIVTKEVYGDYYWFRAPWLFIHVVTGLFATLIGWYQFIPAYRIKNIKRHRILGKVYVYSIVIAAITAIYLAIYSPGMDILGKISFGVVPMVWLSTVAFAYLAILKKNVMQHQEWMLRSYVVTFFFTIFVIVTKYLPYEYLEITYPQALPFITWASWAIPFLLSNIENYFSLLLLD